jgi:hypothetical protein
MMAKRCKEDLLNTVHNLRVSHEKLSAEFWVIRSEGGYETANLLLEVCERITEQIKEIHAELLLREALDE